MSRMMDGIPIMGTTHLCDRILPVRRFISITEVTEMSTGAAPHVPVSVQSTRAKSPATAAVAPDEGADEDAERSSIWSRWTV